MVEKVLDITRDRMLADIAEELKPFVPPDNWFTATEMAELWNLTYSKAYDYLARMNREGRVKKHPPIGGQVYWEMVEGSND